MLFAGYAALGVLCLLLIGGWTVSFVRNKALIDEVSRKCGRTRQAGRGAAQAAAG